MVPLCPPMLGMPSLPQSSRQAIVYLFCFIAPRRVGIDMVAVYSQRRDINSRALNLVLDRGDRGVVHFRRIDPQLHAREALRLDEF